jgi:hypothetical protein
LGERGVCFICIKATRLGVHSKARSENIPGSAGHLLRYQMLDLLMIALGVGFFVASVLYVLACERM